MAKACKWCGGSDHTQFYCRSKPRTPIKRTAIVVRQKTPIVRQRKPIKRLGKQALMWIETKRLWFELHVAALYFCHYCGVRMMKSETTLDHLESRSRHPELRYVLWNLTPACYDCNGLKGSRSHDEYEHFCHTELPIPEPIEKPLLLLPSPAIETPLLQN